jgi:nucleoside-diphosphate-sugar epimerase
MRVLVAGATGAIGRPLVRKLVEAGHEVVGTTRAQEKGEAIRAAGAEPAVVDALDPEALRRAVKEARPEVVVNELTSYQKPLNPRDIEGFLRDTNLLRGRVGPIMAEAAAAAGARRLISHSVCFLYRPEGKGLKREEDPVVQPEDEYAFHLAAGPLGELERSTLETPGLEGIVLRYGYFYGPGTHFAGDGTTASQVRRRLYPVVAKGTGVFSYIHVDDAAAATAAAVERGAPGIYNVCDDDPAPMAEWLPAYAEALGAKPPRRVPVWLARLAAGRPAVEMGLRLRGASNAKAKRELGWELRYPSWRQGFAEALG